MPWGKKRDCLSKERTMPESAGGILKDFIIKEFNSSLGNWRLEH